MSRRKTLLSIGCWLPVCFQLCASGIVFSVTDVAGQDLAETQEQFRRGRYEDVIESAQKNLNAGGSLEWRSLLIKALLTTGRYHEARTNALAAVNSYPANLQTLLQARQADLFQNELESANQRVAQMQIFVQRRIQSAQSGETMVAMGEALLLIGIEPRLVLENFFRRAEKLESPPREAFLATGRLGLEKHDFALAADAFRAGLKKFPEDPDLHGGLAQAFEASNREEMLKSINSALDINPKHVPSLLLLTDHLIDAEQYEEAEKQLALVLKVNASQPEALAYRAVLAHLRNDSVREKEFRELALKFWKTNPQVDFLIGLKLSQKYRFEEGAAAQKRALAFESAYLPARRQLAEDLLRLGRNDEGWELAEIVHKQDEYDVTAYNLTILHDQMGKFRTLTNGDFIVRMSSREAELYGDRVLNLLARAKESLSRKYGVELTCPTTVEIFPEQKDFAVRTFGMPGNPGYLGVCFGSVITANSPASQAPNPANWEDVLWHEFCHVITLSATRNRMPRWLSEGISVYEERQANPAWGEKMNLAYRGLILKGELTPLGKLSSAFLTPKDSEYLQFAYYESSLVIEFLVANYGLETIKKILADLRKGDEINVAIAAHTAPLPDVEKRFAAFAREKAEKLAPQADLEELPDRRSDMPLAVWEKMHPDNYQLRMLKAQELMEAKRWAEARPILESLAASYHGESGAENPLWLLSVTQRNLNDTNAELATLQKFAAQEADFVDMFVRLIEISEARKDWQAASDYAERLLAVNPLISLPHRIQAKSGAALGKNDQAITAYRKLLLLDPADPADAHFQLASLLHARRDSEKEARRHVLQALEEAPRFQDAQQLLLKLSAEKPQAKPDVATP